MGARPVVRGVCAGDIEHVGANLRQADRDEILAARGPVDPTDALRRAVGRSTMCWTWQAEDGEPVCIYGAAPFSLLGDTAAPWALATDRLFESPATTLRLGREAVSLMLFTFRHLVNYVDARNTRSVRWLRRLGFDIHAPAPFGLSGLPFHKFEMRRD